MRSSSWRGVADQGQRRLGVVLVWDREAPAGAGEGRRRQSSPLGSRQPSHLPLPAGAATLVVSGPAVVSSRLAALRYCPALDARIRKLAVMLVSEARRLRRIDVVRGAHGRPLRIGIPLSEVVGDQIPG